MMTSLFAPPELLSAWSYAVVREDRDEHEEPLRPGTHLRVFAGLSGSFPLAPLVVFKLPTRNASFQAHFTDEQGRPVDRADLPHLRTVDLTPEFTDDESERTVRIELFPAEPDDFDARLLDTHGRVVAQRRTGRFLFSAPTLSKFRLIGAELQAMEFGRDLVQIGDLFEFQVQPTPLLALPFRGPGSWYVGVHDRGTAIQRVRGGAPTRLNAMDRPDGPIDELDPDELDPEEEVARVEAMLRSVGFGNGLERLVQALVRDRETPP
jgi:hypothetical protein